MKPLGLQQFLLGHSSQSEPIIGIELFLILWGLSRTKEPDHGNNLLPPPQISTSVQVDRVNTEEPVSIWSGASAANVPHSGRVTCANWTWTSATQTLRPHSVPASTPWPATTSRVASSAPARKAGVDPLVPRTWTTVRASARTAPRVSTWSTTTTAPVPRASQVSTRSEAGEAQRVLILTLLPLFSPRSKLRD